MQNVSLNPSSNLNSSIITSTLNNTTTLEDNVKLKNHIQKLKTEIAFHKIEYNKVENDLKQKEKLITDLLQIEKNKVPDPHNGPVSMGNSQKSKEYNLIIGLKKQINELQFQSKIKEEELEKMKKLIKVTKMNELLIENRTLSEEFHKIKSQYDTSLMNSLVNDKQYQLLNQRILEQGEMLIKKQHKNKKLKEEIKSLKQQISDILAVHQNHIKANNHEEKQSDQHSIKMPNSPISEKQINFNEYEDQIKHLKDDVQFYRELTEKQASLQDEINLLKKTIQEKDEQILHLKNEKELLENKILVNSLNNQNSQSNTIISNTKLESNSEADIDPPLTEDQFGELTYILTKNFEANDIDMIALKEKISESNTYEEESEDKIAEKMGEKIQDLLKNKNQVNKQELVSYCKHFLKNYNPNPLHIHSQFASLFNSITNYSNDNSLQLTQQVKQLLSPYRTMLQNEARKMDPNNTGYITFYNLRKLIETLKLELDEDVMEYIIFLMKNFEDSESYLRDLKYGNLLTLIVEEKEIPVEDIRRGSNSLTSSQVLIPDKEFKTRSEGILQKLAGFLYSQNITTKKYFIQTFVIEEGDRYYTAMYLKLFLRILQNEMNIALDVVDSLCLFNRLKNEFNIYNIEVIDVDKLAEEMEVFGIIEQEELNVNLDANVDKDKETPHEDGKSEINNDANVEGVENNKFEELFQFKEAKVTNGNEQNDQLNDIPFHPDILYFDHEDDKNAKESHKRISKSLIDGVFSSVIESNYTYLF